MTTIIGEFAFLAATLGLFSAFAVSRKKDIEPELEYGVGNYAICLVKGTLENPTYISLHSRSFKNEEEYNLEEESLVMDALDPVKNKKWRDDGVFGIAMIDLKNGREMMFCRMCDYKK